MKGKNKSFFLLLLLLVCVGETDTMPINRGGNILRRVVLHEFISDSCCMIQLRMFCDESLYVLLHHIHVWIPTFV